MQSEDVEVRPYKLLSVLLRTLLVFAIVNPVLQSFSVSNIEVVIHEQMAIFGAIFVWLYVRTYLYKLAIKSSGKEQVKFVISSYISGFVVVTSFYILDFLGLLQIYIHFVDAAIYFFFFVLCLSIVEIFISKIF